MKPYRRFKRFELRWNEALGLSQCPYLTRWVVTLFGASIRLHRWTGSDDKRFFHDHPWDFISVILRGTYSEATPTGIEVRTSGSIRYYPAEYKHTVLFTGAPCWSLVLSGPSRRNFGFWVAGKMIRPLRYFKRFKHHPCE